MDFRLLGAMAYTAPKYTPPPNVRDVYRNNLEEEFAAIRDVIQQFKFVAMEGRFPGTVGRLRGKFTSPPEHKYQVVKCNVDMLHIIQMSFSFFDKDGRTPPGISTWQFNFRFDIWREMCSRQSADELNAARMQFHKLKNDGIDPIQFAALLTTSGLVYQKDITWLVFNGRFPIGYLVKLLTNDELPSCGNGFIDRVRLFFPLLYDVKALVRGGLKLTGDLNKIAKQLGIKRLSDDHLSGSDSFLIGSVFFKILPTHFKYGIDNDIYNGRLYRILTLDPPTPNPEEASCSSALELCSSGSNSPN